MDETRHSFSVFYRVYCREKIGDTVRDLNRATGQTLFARLERFRSEAEAYGPDGQGIIDKIDNLQGRFPDDTKVLPEPDTPTV